MAPNARARKNHDELFPGHVSTLAATDPELIETFDNFAFDEVLRHGNLDARTRLMVQLGVDDRLPGPARVPRHARRGARRRGHSGRDQGDRLPGRAVRRHGQGLRLHPRHERIPDRARRRVAPAGPVHDHAREPRGEGPCGPEADHRRAMSSTTSTPRRPTISCTSSATCRPTASATTTRAPASTRRRASFSPSACSSRSVDASRRSRAMSPPTSTSATTAHGSIDVLTQLLPFIGYPRTLNALRVVDEVTAP